MKLTKPSSKPPFHAGQVWYKRSTRPLGPEKQMVVLLSIAPTSTVSVEKMLRAYPCRVLGDTGRLLLTDVAPWCRLPDSGEPDDLWEYAGEASMDMGDV